MKKILSFGMITIAAITLASCSADEVNDVPQVAQNQAIGFSTYLGRAAQTRGTETTTADIQTANTGFGVFATYTGSDSWNTQGKTWSANFMNNQQVTYAADSESSSSGSWSYSPTKYWPTASGQKISFFAYAPYQSSKNNGITFATSGLPSAEITLQDPDKMIDFVATSVMDQTKPDNGTVNFTLQHEMTKVDITASASQMDKDTKIVITKVTLSNPTSNGGLYKTAIYKFPSSSDANSTTRGTWDYSSTGTNGTPALYSAALDLSSILAKGKQSYTPTLGGTATAGVEVTGGDTNAKSIFKKISDSGTSTHSLFLIPASGETGLTANSVYVNVEFLTVTPLTSSSTDNTYVVMTHEKQLALTTGTLKQGYAYKFNLVFNMDAVKLNITSVASWGTTNDNSSSLNL